MHGNFPHDGVSPPLDSNKPLFAGLEMGGTRFICAIADSRGFIKARTEIPTGAPDATMAAVRDYLLATAPQFGDLISLGVVCFGPLELHRRSPQFGFVTRTPRPGWSNLDVVGYFKRELNVMVDLTTDVNGSAIGEFTEGAGVGCENFVYVTVGTGIAAGIFAGGKIMQGISHPEVGHMLVPMHPSDTSFAGGCPFHGPCLEGLASGVAIEKRWGVSSKTLPENHHAWNLEAHYLAEMCVNLTWMYAPEKIIFGGGVMSRGFLFPRIRNNLRGMLNHYAHDAALNDMDAYIVPTTLGGNAGITGALALARGAYLDAKLGSRSEED